MSKDFGVALVEARSIIHRMLHDWPYQPPEVITPEREAIQRWYDAPENRPASAYLAALHALGSDSDVP